MGKSAAQSDEAERMFGDVNFFINRVREDDGTVSIVGEMEIMIARKDIQGEGYGKALLKALIWYVVRHHDRIMKEYQKGEGLKHLPNLDYLHCRVGRDNFRSIWLFESLDFRKVNEVPNSFEEFEMRWDVTMQKRIDVVEEGEEIGLKEEDYLL
jgi:GNAT superfamily N-acetyltransferase